MWVRRLASPDLRSSQGRDSEVSSSNQKPGEHQQRKTVIMLLAGCIGLLVSFMLSQASFDLPFLRPTSSEQTLVFATLSAIIFLLLLVLSFVLVRTLVKLFAER